GKEGRTDVRFILPGAVVSADGGSEECSARVVGAEAYGHRVEVRRRPAAAKAVALMKLAIRAAPKAFALQLKTCRDDARLAAKGEWHLRRWRRQQTLPKQRLILDAS